MSQHDGQLTIVVSCPRESRPEQAVYQQLLIDELVRHGYAVDVVPHLYDLTPQGDGAACLRTIQGNLAVFAWLYPRAAFWVLDANAVTGQMGHTSFDADEPGPPSEERPSHRGQRAQRRIWCFDLRDDRPIAAHLAEVQRIAAESGRAAKEAQATPGEARWHESQRLANRWYPVIDYDRCDDCLECLNFCLFGVYELGPSGGLIVDRPDACRDGCPACSRVCPAAAIMFPQHKDPAIGGDAKAAAESLKLDLSALLGGSSAIESARAERQRALAQSAGERPRAGDQPAAPHDKRLDRLIDGIDAMDGDV